MPFYLIYGEGGIAYDNDDNEVHNLQLLSPTPLPANSFADAKQKYLNCRDIGEQIATGAYNNYVIHEVLPNCICFDSPVPTTNDTEEVE